MCALKVELRVRVPAYSAPGKSVFNYIENNMLKGHSLPMRLDDAVINQIRFEIAQCLLMYPSLGEFFHRQPELAELIMNEDVSDFVVDGSSDIPSLQQVFDDERRASKLHIQHKRREPADSRD